MRICTRLCHNRLVDYCLKAHIFGGSAVKSVIESADSIAESADSTTDSVIVSRLALLNMFDILPPLEPADGNRPTIAVGRREIGPVGTGL